MLRPDRIRHVPSTVICNPHGRGYVTTEAYLEVPCRDGVVRIYPDRLVVQPGSRGIPSVRPGRIEAVPERRRSIHLA